MPLNRILDVTAFIFAVGVLLMSSFLAFHFLVYSPKNSLSPEDLAVSSVAARFLNITDEGIFPDGKKHYRYYIGGETGYITPFLNTPPASAVDAERKQLADRFIHVISHEKIGNDDIYKLAVGKGLRCSVSVLRTKHGYWQNMPPSCEQIGKDIENPQAVQKAKAYE